MNLHTAIIGALLTLAVVLTSACAVGIAIMPAALQRLHFSAPVTSLAIGLVVAAVWIEDSDWQARIKIVLIAVILLLMNAILSHATGRAFFIRDRRAGEPMGKTES